MPHTAVTAVTQWLGVRTRLASASPLNSCRPASLLPRAAALSPARLQVHRRLAGAHLLVGGGLHLLLLRLQRPQVGG